MNLLATTLSLVVGDPAASAGFLAAHFGFREVLAFDGGAAVEHPGGGPTLFFLREGLATLDPSQRHVLAQGITFSSAMRSAIRQSQRRVTSATTGSR